MLFSEKDSPFSTVQSRRGKNWLTLHNSRRVLSLLLVAITLAGSFATGTAKAASTGYSGGKTLGSVLQGPVLLDPPTITLAYDTKYVALNGAATLTLTIANPNPSGALGGISVADNLPTGLVVVGQNLVNPGSCNGTITAAEGSSQISISGVTVNAESNCTVNVSVKGTQVGYTHNTSGVITATNSEAGTTSNEAILAVGLALVVTPTSGLTTTEKGGTATFYVSLNTEPEGNVIVGLTSNNKAEGIISEADPCMVKNCFILEDGSGPQAGKPSADAYMYFSSYNWNTPLQVVIKGQDDLVIDGDQNYTVTVDPSFSDNDDPYFNLAPSVQVNLVNEDNDGVPGIVATPASGLVTSESGTSTTFAVKLASQPSDLVKIVYSSTNPAEGVVQGNPCGISPSPAAKAITSGDGDTAKGNSCYSPEGANPNGPIQPNTLYFYKENWNIPQTLTVTGVDDSLVDGDQPYQIKLDPSTSIEEGYMTLAPVFVDVTNLDNDVPGSVLVSSPIRPTTSSDQPTTTFTVVLQTAPTAQVIIPLSSSNPARGTVVQDSVTFTPENWNVPQIVTVTTNPGNPGRFVILTGTATSADPAYNGFDAPDVAIVVRGKTVAQPAELYTTLRVTPDREYGVASTDFLTYSFVVKNSGPGQANRAYLRLPLDGSLETATASFSDPQVWVEKIVTEGSEQYVQIRLAPLESNQTVSGTISFLPKSGVQPGTIVTERALTIWDDDSGTGRWRASNAVRLSLVEGATSRNDTGGEVQFFSQVGETVGTVLKLRGDFYAPDEVVTFWYTTKDGKSTELGNATAGDDGVLVFEVNFKDWPSGQPVIIAGRGNQSGVTGSSVLVIGEASGSSQASGTTVTFQLPDAFETWQLRQNSF